MPDFLRVFERTAKATRSVFGRVGALVDRTLPPEVAFLVDAAKKADEDDALAEFYCGRRLYALGPNGKTLMFEPGNWYLGPPAAGAAAGTDPEAVSDGSTETAPASGLRVVGGEDPCTIAAAFFPQHTRTSAAPPAAVDGPAEVTPHLRRVDPLEDWDAFSLEVLASANARAEQYRTNLLMEAGIDVEALDEDHEFDWVTWVQPAITDVLAEHMPEENRFVGKPVRCYSTDMSVHGGFVDKQQWREHVAGLIAERIHSAAAAQK